MSYNYQWNNQASYNEAYHEARRIVRAKIGFFISLANYIVVNSLLFFIWFSTQNSTEVYFGDGFHIRNASYPWFLWVLVPWGIGLIFHFLRAFVYTGYSRQRMIEREMRRMGLEPQSGTYYPAAPANNQEQTTGSESKKF